MTQAIPTLQNLDGTALDWPTLQARVADWYASHDRYGRAFETAGEERWLPMRGCLNCRTGIHGSCSGKRKHSSDGRLVLCECSARSHEMAA